MSRDHESRRLEISTGASRSLPQNPTHHDMLIAIIDSSPLTYSKRESRMKASGPRDFSETVPLSHHIRLATC